MQDEGAVSRPEAVARIHDGFREGRADDVAAVRRWVGSVVGGGNWRFEDAEGVIQEILLVLMQGAREERVKDPSSFQKFAYTVAKNTCVTIYHRERRRATREDPAVDPDALPHDAEPDRALVARERLEAMAYILQRLSPACRELWDLVYRRKASAEEVARTLGTTAGNVRVRTHRCLERARAIRDELLAWPAHGTAS